MMEKDLTIANYLTSKKVFEKEIIFHMSLTNIHWLVTQSSIINTHLNN